MRKVLYSPDWGAGWSTWNSGETAKYFLEYQPIIDFLEAGNKFSDKDCHCYCAPCSGSSSRKSKCTLHPLLKQLQEECKEKFGNTYVCVLGADDLKVAEVSGRIRINEYDGNESIEEEGEYSGWL